MFKFSSIPVGNYFWPVTVAVPAGDVGATVEQSFDAQFKRMSKPEVDALDKDAGGDFSKFARIVVTGWSGVVGDDGAQVPFSADGLEQMLAVPQAALAIYRSFYESLSGRIAKN